MSGFYAMHRGWMDNPALKGGAFSRRDAWIWLIENACWKPTAVRIKGQTVQIERGELCYSVRFLAQRWGWSKSKVDRFIADLRAEGMIQTRSKIGTPSGTTAGQGQSIISVCNYAKYQDRQIEERDNSGTPSGTTAGQQRDKEEEGNKGRSIPLSKDNGADGPLPDPEKQFWANAKALIVSSGRTEKQAGSIVGGWLKKHRREPTMAALSAAQLEKAVDPVAYCEGYFRRHFAQAQEPVIGV